MSSSISILLLAAGASARFGKPKQLLPYRNRSLLRHVAEVATSSSTSATSVVLGFEADRMKQELSGLPLTILNNSKWQEGIASSIRTGISSLPASVDAALIMLCDQALISVEILNTIIATYLAAGKRIVASEYAGTIGVPALFGKEFFPELLQLKGDKGAKEVLRCYSAICGRVPFPGGEKDIDLPNDAAHLSQ